MKQAQLTRTTHYFGKLAPVKSHRIYAQAAASFVHALHICVPICLVIRIKGQACPNQVYPLKVAQRFLTTSAMEEGCATNDC